MNVYVYPNQLPAETTLQALRRRLEAAVIAVVIEAGGARHEDTQLFYGLSEIGDRLIEELAKLDELIHSREYKREAP